MWLWISAFIVLLGAEMNAETEVPTAADSTVGHDQPMGSRGAAKADRPGEARPPPDLASPVAGQMHSVLILHAQARPRTRLYQR
jgi:hypothetical protein